MFKNTTVLLLTLITCLLPAESRSASATTSVVGVAVSSGSGCIQYWDRDGKGVPCSLLPSRQDRPSGDASPQLPVLQPQTERREVRGSATGAQHGGRQVPSPALSISSGTRSGSLGAPQEGQPQSDAASATGIDGQVERSDGPVGLSLREEPATTEVEESRQATVRANEVSEGEKRDRGSESHEGQRQGRNTTPPPLTRESGEGLAHPQPRSAVSEPDQGGKQEAATSDLEEHDSTENSTQGRRSVAHTRNTMILSAALCLLSY